MLDKSHFRGSSAWKKKRREILDRDKHKCKICCNKEGLQVHHILALDLYPQLKLDNNNLITLCESCHLKAHNGVFSTYYLMKKITTK